MTTGDKGYDSQSWLYAEVAAWTGRLREFREWEDESMLSREASPENLAVHKAALRGLIADGEHLLALTAELGLPENAEGLSEGSLAATVEALRADYRGWHRPMPPDQRAKVLRDAFPDLQRGAQGN